LKPNGPTPATETSLRPAPPRARPLVLLLDDEESILQPTATYFRSQGCEVDTAREHEEAEALVQFRCYDLAILDLRVDAVGGAAGLEVLREIRRHDEATSVIVLSAYVSYEVELEAWALGADSVLCKPQPLPGLAQLAFSLMGSKR
jgi:DNA-binding response OmpR family regulator